MQFTEDNSKDSLINAHTSVLKIIPRKLAQAIRRDYIPKLDYDSRLRTLKTINMIKDIFPMTSRNRA